MEPCVDIAGRLSVPEQIASQGRSEKNRGSFSEQKLEISGGPLTGGDWDAKTLNILGRAVAIRLNLVHCFLRPKRRRLIAGWHFARTNTEKGVNARSFSVRCGQQSNIGYDLFSR